MANKSTINTFALDFKTDNPDLILSQLYDVLSDSTPLSKAFQKPQEGTSYNPDETKKKFELLFTLDFKDLIQPYRVNIMAGVINKLQSIPNLTHQQSSHLIQLQALHALVNDYVTAKSTIMSADDFVKSRAATKTQLERSGKGYAHAKEEEFSLHIQSARFQALLEDIDRQLATLQSRRGLLSSLLSRKVGESTRATRSKKELACKTQLLLNDLEESTKMVKLWEKEKASACGQVEKIEGEWESIRASFLHRS